ARQCNCSYRTVQRAFRFFKRRGYLIVTRRWNTSSICQITKRFLAQLTEPMLSAASWLRHQLGIGTSPTGRHPSQPTRPHPNLRFSAKSQTVVSRTALACLSGSKPTSPAPQLLVSAPRKKGIPEPFRGQIAELRARIAADLEARKNTLRFNVQKL
ncbi:MAG: hypothetical protein LBI48_09395, partial [Burkholderiaceae bacterium]|nr:hypothetical protein [Burkholderiaceae bacterium]